MERRLRQRALAPHTPSYWTCQLTLSVPGPSRESEFDRIAESSHDYPGTVTGPRMARKTRLEIQLDRKNILWLQHESLRRGESMASIIREAIRKLRESTRARV